MCVRHLCVQFVQGHDCGLAEILISSLHKENKLPCTTEAWSILYCYLLYAICQACVWMLYCLSARFNYGVTLLTSPTHLLSKIKISWGQSLHTKYKSSAITNTYYIYFNVSRRSFSCGAGGKIFPQNRIQHYLHVCLIEIHIICWVWLYDGLKSIM